MRTIIQICKLELKTLFSTPVAWLLMVIFALQIGFNFIQNFTYALMYQGEGNLNNELTNRLYADNIGGVFFKAEQILFFYIPLITMGLISRELNSGSIKLLLSSPIRIGEIVAGKFLAVLVYWLLIILIIWIYVAAGYFTIDHIDLYLILSATLGVFLLACLYSSVGLFISCLTPYQVVAGIFTLIILSILNYMQGVGQGIAYVRNISWFLDVKQHTVNMINGLIVTRDIWYFFLLSILFLAFTVLHLKSQTESRPFYIKFGRYITVAVLVFIAGYFVSLKAFTGYLDVTAYKDNTLSPYTKNIFKQLKGKVTITAYDNLFSTMLSGISELKNRNSLLQAWEPYERFFPDVKYRYVGYFDTVKNMHLKDSRSLREKALEVARQKRVDLSHYLPPESIHKIVDLSLVGNRSVWMIENNGKKAYLESSIGGLVPFAAENDVATSFKRLTASAPKIAFLTGHGERSIIDPGDKNYSAFATDRVGGDPLTRYGFDVISITLEKPLPSDINILVIADPLIPYTKEDIKKIETYINKGGNMIIAGEPGKQFLLNPLINKLGLEFMSGILVEPSKDYSPDLIFTGFSSTAFQYCPVFSTFRADQRKVFLQGAAGIKFSTNKQFIINPILVTNSKDTWNKTSGFVPDMGKLSYNPAAGDTHLQIPVAVAATRNTGKRKQRIIVIADADILSNAQYFKQLDNSVNIEFMQNISRWLTYGQFPVEISRPEIKSVILVNHSGARMMKILLMGVFPGIIVVLALVYLTKRNKQK